MAELTAREIAEVLLGLRRKVLKIVLIIGIVWALSFTVVTDYLIIRFQEDLLPKGAKIVFIHPLEPLILKLKISLYMGIAAALPYMGKVVIDTLKQRTDLLKDFELSKSKAIQYGISALILFLIGISYGYRIMLPVFMNFLYSFAARQGALAYYTISEFVTFVVLMLLVFGFVFELPIIMFFLVNNDVIKYSTLTYYRRHFYVGFFIIGAIITPPDIFTQIMVACPMILFFEISLLVIRLVLKDKIKS